MSYSDQIHSAWLQAQQKLFSTPFFQQLKNGSLTLDHYKIFLRETYYNVRENPPTLALMASNLHGKKMGISGKLYRHCSAEFGHHDMALADLQALGYNTEKIPNGRPMPTTEAMLAFAVYQIERSNPLAYLGYMYHLEMLPALSGDGLIRSLSAIGVPKEAMSFLEEHAHLDPVHTKWLQDYFVETIENQEDLDAIIHGAVGTCQLHGIMLQGILDALH